MSDKDFQKMLIILKRLIKSVEGYKEEPDDAPIMLPPKVYDEICDIMHQDHISLFGIS